ncbi:TIR domain-containing protein [Paenibacillus cremeus]|uniref:Thoeris protein ThsB TIR-like domain-containing protein n=1 Tax=Paenibacillus cremeus TaxID=2163881 RepID=A0A559K5C7_9BACL|nr:TIR domain-containing protein [Paenibacillus cremeus]TVY07345.1 hypothetical protein FPZ49_24180 [Paenibacillus cremeus]
MTHKVFVSYQHSRDQHYANIIRDFYGRNDAFINRSLPQAINSSDNDYILGLIRTRYLKDSTVTIVLIGSETWSRKWVDWEIYSSLRGYGSRSNNGLLGILLPNSGPLPSRFQDNYRETTDQLGRTFQTGYALLINWESIAPPNGWNFSHFNPFIKQEIDRKRAELEKWIQYAFEYRKNTDRINNTRDRMSNNRYVKRF